MGLTNAYHDSPQYCNVAFDAQSCDRIIALAACLAIGTVAGTSFSEWWGLFSAGHGSPQHVRCRVLVVLRYQKLTVFPLRGTTSTSVES